MATTSIFAEILIVGFEACCWLALAVVGLFGAGWLDPGAFSDWVALVVLLVTAAAYALGILVDRFADSLQSLLRRLWPSAPVEKPAGISTMQHVLRHEAPEEPRRFVEYQRSRQRIARATALNLWLSAIAAGIVLPLRTGASVRDAAVLAVLLFAGGASAQLAYRRIELAYLRRLGESYVLLRPKDEPKQVDRAAAVPYRRRRDGRLELLVVRTSTGRWWTFPKGRRDRDDASWADTAAREAREEAGVGGRLDGRRLGEFDYPHGGGTVRVAAYLLERRRPPRRRLPGTDAARERVWGTPAEVKELLARDRTGEAAAELWRIVDRAVKRAGPSRPRRFRLRSRAAAAPVTSPAGPRAP